MGEIDGLVAASVLTKEGGDALRVHYTPYLEKDMSRMRVALFSVIGCLLIGTGAVLLVGHNWEYLGRPARAITSVLPVIFGTCFSVWAARRHRDSAAWRECAGVLQAISVAASIGLVSQTYNITGNVSDFILTCVLLTLPLPYLLDAVAPALLCVAGITIWSVGPLCIEFYDSGPDHPAIYWALLAALIPFCALCFRRKASGIGSAWLSAGIAISLFVRLVANLSSTGMLSEIAKSTLGFCGLSGALYLTGVLLFPDNRRQPFRVIGSLGIAVIPLIFSYRGIWNNVDVGLASELRATDVIALLLAITSAPLFVIAVRRRADCNWVAASISVVGILGSLACCYSAPVPGVLLFNAYAAVLGISSILRGIRTRRMGTCNAGLLIVGLLIFERFTDGDFSFLIRGIAFVTIGVAILAVNLLTLRKQRAFL